MLNWNRAVANGLRAVPSRLARRSSSERGRLNLPQVRDELVEQRLLRDRNVLPFELCHEGIVGRMPMAWTFQYHPRRRG
jgi:hypothetical protein